MATTKGLPPTTARPPASTRSSFNEVESNGDPVGDWAELKNTSADPVDISGLKFKDGDDAHPFYTIPGGTTHRRRAATTCCSRPSSTSASAAPDTVRALQDRRDDPGRHPTAGPRTRPRPTAAAPTGPAPSRRPRRRPRATANNCAPLLKINEIESDGGTPGDWVELYNYGTVADRRLRARSSRTATTRTSTRSRPARASPRAATWCSRRQPLGFGLDGATRPGCSPTRRHDAYRHLHLDRARDHQLRPLPQRHRGVRDHPGGHQGRAQQLPRRPRHRGLARRRTVTAVDPAGALGGDISGLTYEGSGSSTPGVLWAVNNGDGSLIRMLWSGTQWVSDTANGWSAAGKPLKYANGVGTPDTEGVTLTGRRLGRRHLHRDRAGQRRQRDQQADDPALRRQRFGHDPDRHPRVEHDGRTCPRGWPPTRASRRSPGSPTPT